MISESLFIGWTKGDVFLFHRALFVVPLIVGDVWAIQRLTQVVVGFEMLDWRAVFFDVLQLTPIEFIKWWFAYIFISESQLRSLLSEWLFVCFWVSGCFAGIFCEGREAVLFLEGCLNAGWASCFISLELVVVLWEGEVLFWIFLTTLHRNYVYDSKYHINMISSSIKSDSLTTPFLHTISCNTKII